MTSPNYSDSRTATGPLIFVSGQIPLDAAGNLVGATMTEQANAVLDNIAGVLARSGATLHGLVKMTYFLTDIGQLAELRAVLAERLPHPRPAASLVAVTALIDPRFLIEIEAVAAFPPSGS